MNTQLQATLIEAAEQKRLVESTRAEIAAVQSQKAALEKRISDLQSELNGLRGKNSDALGKVKIELGRATTEKEALDEELLVLRESEQEANKRAAIAQGEARKSAEREAATQMELKETLKALDSLTKRCSGLTSLQGDLATWKRLVAEKLEEISLLKQQKMGDSGRSATLETEVKRLQGQIAGQVLAHTKETEAINRELQKAQAEIAALSSQLSKSEASARLSDDAQRQIENIRATCAEREAHLQSLLRGRLVTEAVAREPEVLGTAKQSGLHGYSAATASQKARMEGVKGAYNPRIGGRTYRKGARLAKTKKRLSPLI